MKIGRNEPCPCGSGKKYKHCCLNAQEKTSMTLLQKLLATLFALILIGGAIAALGAFRSHDSSMSAGPGKVWSEEHQHWH